MKAGTVVGMAVAVLALILAIAALATAPEGADELKPEIAALKGEMARVSSELRELGASLDKLADRISRLQRACAKAPAPAGVDDEKVREILRDEMRAQFERFRRDRGDRGDRAGRGGRGGRETPEALRERVGLDEEKAEQLTQIQTRLREGIGSIWREGRDRGRDKNMELMRALQKKAEEEIAKLLTPEEMEKYRELMNRGGRGRGRRPHGGEEDHPAAEEDAGDAAF